MEETNGPIFTPPEIVFNPSEIPDESLTEKDKTISEEGGPGVVAVEETPPSPEAEARKKLKDYANNLLVNNQARLEERGKNCNVEYPEESFYSTLDSKLKSCTGYIKKLKNLTESQHEILEKDFAGLNLTRYVSEATQALAEAKLKISDIGTAMDVCRLIHRRYPDFSVSMLDSWKRVLPLQKGDLVGNPSKIRVDLRFLPDQILTGLLPMKQSLATLTSLLQTLVDSDKEDRIMLPLITAFAKSFAYEFLGVHPKRMRLLAEQLDINLDSLFPPQLRYLSTEAQSSLRGVIHKYFDTLCRQVVQENQRLRDLEKAHGRLLASRGDVPPERLEKYQTLLASFAKLKTAVLNLADLIDLELPVLAPKEELEDSRTTIELLTVEFGDPSGLSPTWNDEDERDFYENLPDLKATMPSMAYKDSLAESAVAVNGEQQSSEESDMSILDAVIKADSELTLNVVAKDPSEPSQSPCRQTSAKATTLAQASAAKIMENQLSNRKHLHNMKRPYVRNAKSKGLADLLDTLFEGDEMDNEEEPAIIVEDDHDSTPSVLKQILEAFLANLQKLTSKEAVDKMAVDFCTNLNRRHYRKRLVQALYNVPRTRTDLLPVYSRLVAVLNPVMPDVGSDLADSLRRQFRWLVRKQDPLRLESKIRSVRFLAELTKFAIFPKSEALLCLKILLTNFRHHAVEMVCSLLESAGRYLYWSVDSHSRTKILLEELVRKKGLMHFDARMESMIENAYLACGTPDSAARRSATSRIVKIRTPMQMFIRNIFLSELNTGDPNVLMGLLRRLPWDDPATLDYTVKYLSSAWKINYASIPALANILAGIANYQDDVAVRVVDNVLEDIRVQLELNSAKFNQRRLAMLRYLGEMYNYRIVDSTVIFNTFFSLLLFGWLGDVPTDLDPPQHLLRIRLICVLLNTCGHYFGHGSARRRLDYFLALFRRYFWLKKESFVWHDQCPFPTAIHHLVEDTLARLRRDFPLLKSLQEAEAALKKYEKMQDKISVDEVLMAMDAEKEDSSPDESEEEKASSGESSRSGSHTDLSLLNGFNQSPAVSAASADGTLNTAVQEEAAVKQDVVVNLDDVDFMAAFDKLASESYQAQAQSKVPPFKSAIPSSVKEQLETASDVMNDKESEGDGMRNQVSTVRVGLMTKKGQKQHHIRFMDVPEDTNYVTLWRDAEENERRERREMVRLTLDISNRQQREEYEEMVNSVNRSLLPQQSYAHRTRVSSSSAVSHPLPSSLYAGAGHIHPHSPRPAPPTAPSSTYRGGGGGGGYSHDSNYR